MLTTIAGVADRAVERIKPFKRAITLGAFAVLLALLAWQTVRIEGFGFLHDGYKEQLDDCQNAALKALPTVRDADAKAGEAVEATQADVEAANQRARDAAAGSDDPLKAGLEALR